MIELLSLYNSIPSADKKRFQNFMETINKSKGDYLLFDGDIQHELYMVRDGVTVLYDDSGDKRRIIDFAYHNRFGADFVSFSSQSPSKYCIECLSDCEIQSISYDNLQLAFDESHAIERAFRILLERLLVSSIQNNLKNQELTMEERFKLIMHNKPELFRLVSHKYIASYANIDVTNFSKLYNRLCVNSGFIYQ